MTKSPTFHPSVAHQTIDAKATELAPSQAGRVNSDDDLLDPREAARELNCSKSYLDKLRCYGGGPPFLRIGRRMVRYQRGDAKKWAHSHRFNSTSEYKS